MVGGYGRTGEGTGVVRKSVAHDLYPWPTIPNILMALVSIRPHGASQSGRHRAECAPVLLSPSIRNRAATGCHRADGSPPSRLLGGQGTSTRLDDAPPSRAGIGLPTHLDPHFATPPEGFMPLLPASSDVHAKRYTPCPPRIAAHGIAAEERGILRLGGADHVFNHWHYITCDLGGRVFLFSHLRRVDSSRPHPRACQYRLALDSKGPASGAFETLRGQRSSGLAIASIGERIGWAGFAANDAASRLLPFYTPK